MSVEVFLNCTIVLKNSIIKNTTCLEKMVYSAIENYMFRPLLAIFRFLQY